MDLTFDSFVLAASTADLGEEPDAREHAAAVEFRMDLADDPLSALDAYEGALPIIATNRARWEGGEADDEGRLDALVAAAEYPSVAAVDVELASLRDPAGAEAADAAREAGAAVIASAHDFEGTSPESELRRIVHEAAGR
ncbi:MAG: type I 3-dehydroquinate dehydratase, partial [Salinigranum sp.]